MSDTNLQDGQGCNECDMYEKLYQRLKKENDQLKAQLAAHQELIKDAAPLLHQYDEYRRDKHFNQAIDLLKGFESWQALEDK